MTFWKPAVIRTTDNIQETKRKAGASSSGQSMRKNRYAPNAIVPDGSMRTDQGQLQSTVQVSAVKAVKTEICTRTLKVPSA